MAELHVQRKRNNYLWLWLLVIVIITAAGFYYYIHYYRKDNLEVNSKSSGFIQKDGGRIFNFNKNVI